MLKNNNLNVDNELVSNHIQNMLNEFNGNNDIDFEENLSDSQKKAFKIFKENKNLLFISEAGCGKSYCIKLIQEYIKLNTLKKIVLTSTTGISAYNLNGITMHSFFGIGTGEQSVDVLIRKIMRYKIYKERIETTDIIVIDEISMLSGEIFEKLNIICQNIRRNKSFMGGMQVILSMDPLQLCPIFNKNKDIYKNKIDERLIIESNIFNKEFKKNENIVVLKENFRQKNDPLFNKLLSRIRDGTFIDSDIKLLETRKYNDNVNNLKVNPNKIVHLVSSNYKAQNINNLNINKIKDIPFKYISSYNNIGKNKDLCDLLNKELEYQLKLKGIHELVLKKDTRVMLIKNLDIPLGLVNGAIGTIIEIKNTPDGDFPLIKFDNDIEQLITPYTWEIEIDNNKATAVQLPLMLAYAITINKSQSLTLDSAILDLEDAFADGQIYVALSRVRSLDGIYLKSFNPAKIKVNKKMKKYLDNLN